MGPFARWMAGTLSVVLLLLTPRAARAEVGALELVRLAESADPADHAALRRRLADGALVARLMEQEKASQTHRRCGLGAPPYRPSSGCATRPDPSRSPVRAIACALAANPAEVAQATFVALARTRPFERDSDAGDVLVEASSVIRQPSAGLVALWRHWFTPEWATSNLMDAVLLDNASPAALGLLRQRFASRAHDLETRLGWVFSVHVRREQPAVLRLVRQLLADPIALGIKRELVRAVFGAIESRSGHTATPWSAAPPDARAELEAVGRLALGLRGLDDDLRRAVEQTLASLAAEP